MEESILEVVKKSWAIKKKEIKDLGIDPNKEWGQMTIDEIDIIAGHLELTPSEFIEYS